MAVLVKISGFNDPKDAKDGATLIRFSDEEIMRFVEARGMATKVLQRAKQAGLDVYPYRDMNMMQVGVELVRPDNTEALITIAFGDPPQGFLVEEWKGDREEEIGYSKSIDEAILMAMPDTKLPPMPQPQPPTAKATTPDPEA